MDAEFRKLYLIWYNRNFLSSIRDFDNDPEWKNLVDWCLEHKKEAVQSIYEQIKEEPNDTVYILDILFDHPLKVDGFVPLNKYCEVWVGLLNDYVKEYGKE